MYFENQASFSMRVFVWWVVVGCAQSLAIYTFAVNVVGDGIVWIHGREGGYLVLGNFVYTVSTRMALHPTNINHTKKEGRILILKY